MAARAEKVYEKGMGQDGGKGETAGAAKWYELFSRGARDWLRHDEKVREAVRANLPEIIAGGDVINGGARTVRVPVRMLEHYHFRLRRPEESQGAGQGKAKPGDVFSAPGREQGQGEKGPGGRDEGEVQLKAGDVLIQRGTNHAWSNRTDEPAVLAFVLAHRFAVSKVRVSPPFQLCVPDHPQGYWLAESVGTAMVSDAHLVFLYYGWRSCLG